MALANSNGYTATSSQREESHSVINFKTGYSNSIHNSGSLLIFDQNDQIPQNPHPQQHGYTIWEDNYDPIQNYQNQLNPQRTASNSRLLQDIDSVDQCGNAFGWPVSDEANAIPTSGTNREFGTKEACSNKRPHTNRRERITERLKVLQELVPNGSKVDLVTMLEKAISYVKFLQLQVKVLATDEFWPVRGGKAPDISQVKEAIDSILSSHKDRNSSSD
ncbi:hypothetical protein RHMOL_Rhmol10G0101400 [Rhododendron molle]|uniref:Uncharacterized protein n=1 Tax=Rhododendron molle TaxID=49168 RepID=A0ACC0M154_RHOML|nr:hypothetical protein RHMOL_Rhmol10G0101400 [Rhododendron molle]